MRASTVGVLVALGAAAVAGGWYFGTATTPPQQTTAAAGTLMFPDLAPRLRDAVKVQMTYQGKETVIEKRSDGRWGIASLHDYPIQETKLRGLLTGLTELRLSEPRTSDPAQLSRLGLNDPNGAGSSAVLLRILDGSGKPIAAMIAGHRRVRSQGNAAEEIYVRRPGETQSWLAEGTVQADADPAQWLDRDILNIGHDRIASVAAGDLVLARVDGQFLVRQPSDHPKLEDYKIDDVARALEMLTLQAVKLDAETPGQMTGQAEFTMNDGLAIRITLFHADKDVWARFVASGPDAVKAEVNRLNGRLAGWCYQIASWKEKSLMPTIDDLKAEEKPAAEAK